MDRMSEQEGSDTVCFRKMREYPVEGSVQALSYEMVLLPADKKSEVHRTGPVRPSRHY